VRWSAQSSQPYVVETIPRITKQNYYMDMYRQYRADHGHLPIKILGGNPAQGGDLRDPAIVGFLDDHAYYQQAAQARVSIYHGKSRYHVHYHPIEFMALGVPVLFHENSAFAAEGQQAGLSWKELQEAGMYRDIEQANQMASRALQDVSLAEQISRRQRVFVERIFSRDKALDQARWIKSRVHQINGWYKQQSELFRTQQTSKAAAEPVVTVTPTIQVDAPKPKRTIPVRVYREIKRALRRTLHSA
jgi:hypothetical protein